MNRYETIRLRVDDVVGTIVLNRPNARNALSAAMISEIRSALEDLHAERSVRGVVLAAAGLDFCGGLDLREMHAASRRADAANYWADDVERVRGLCEQLLRIPKPVVVAVQGAAAGAALGLAAAADLCVAASDARFFSPETLRGLAPGLSAAPLALRVGAATAARLLVMGQTFNAAEALRVGLVGEVVAPEQLWVRSAEAVRESARGAPQAVQFAKQTLNEAILERFAELGSAGAALSAASRTTVTAEEGLSAFIEKRAPNWP